MTEHPDEESSVHSGQRGTELVEVSAVKSRKGFSAYLFDFFMLFLAVFCGFLAEHYREFRAERQREKDFIVSLVEDLHKDAANAGSDIEGFHAQYRLIDSIFVQFNSLTSRYQPVLFSQLTRTMSFPDFIYNDKTMQQLKSAGNMRLIRNKIAVDSIMDYDTNIRDYSLESNALGKILQDYESMFYSVIDVQKLNADVASNSPALSNGKGKYLITTDPEKLAALRNKLQLLQVYFNANAKREAVIKAKAERLIKTLQGEYGMKEGGG